MSDAGGQFPGGRTESTTVEVEPLVWQLLLGGGAAVVLGAFLAWATFGPFSVSGTSGDGKLTLVAGIVVVVIGWAAREKTSRGRLWAALVVAVLALAIGVYDTINISSKGNNLFHAEVGIGLWITDAGAAAAAIGSARGLFRKRDAPTSF